MLRTEKCGLRLQMHCLDSLSSDSVTIEHMNDLMTGRLAQCEERIRRLEAVVETSFLVNSTLDLRQLAVHIIESATRLIGAERGSLFLIDAQNQTLTSLVAQGLDSDTISVPIGKGIVGAVAASGKPLILNSPYTDERFDAQFDRSTGFVTHSLLTVPVRDREGTLTAVLQLLNHNKEEFSAEDVAFLAELGVAFAIALTSARLHQHMVAQARMKEELRMAAEIQRGLQPKEEATVPGLEIETLTRPCLEVGGDYFDLIPLPGGERWWLVMADVSGKGVSAGLIAANIQAYLWTRRNHPRPLENVMAAGNDLLFRLTNGRKFATMALAEWTPGERRLRWVSAGHLPILLSHDGAVSVFEATGRPIGLLPDQTYSSGEITLNESDYFVMYTDGVLEAGMGSQHDEFGLDRLLACLPGEPGAGAVVERISTALADFVGDAPPDDDVTVLCARSTGA